MKITKRVKAIGSLINMNQAVRLISNLGGVITGVGDLEVCFFDGDEHTSIRFAETENGRIVMA